MNKLKFISGLIVLILAITFSLFSSLVLPENLFEPYIIKLDSTWPKTIDEKEYIIDIKNDSTIKTIIHHQINKPGNSIEYRYNNKLNQIYIFAGKEFFISKSLYMADIDEDLFKDIIFISVLDELAYLNILKYDPDKDLFLSLPKVKIDSVKYFHNLPDVVNNSMISLQSDIYFDLNAAYSIQPRHIYKYNVKSKQILKTDINSIVIKNTDYIQYDQNTYVLATEIKASGNTINYEEMLSLKNSKDDDTLKIYEDLKHLEYKYGDFSSYILVYTDQLKFAFEPIEFYGWTNFTKSKFLFLNQQPHIIALTNTIKGDSSNKLLSLCNLNGEVLVQKNSIMTIKIFIHLINKSF